MKIKCFLHEFFKLNYFIVCHTFLSNVLLSVAVRVIGEVKLIESYLITFKLNKATSCFSFPPARGFTVKSRIKDIPKIIIYNYFL